MSVESLEEIRYPDDNQYAGSIAELIITPAMHSLSDPIPTYILNRFTDGCRLHTVMNVCDQVLAVATVQVSEVDITTWVNRLKKIRVPAYPVSVVTADGSLIELTIFGEQSALKVSWWTQSPEGFELLGEFADWIEALGTADSPMSNEDLPG